MLPYIDFFGIRIGSYGLMMAIAFLVVGAACILRGKPRGILPEDVLIIGAVAIGIGLLGAKITYILVTYSVEELWRLLCAGDFRFLNGGLVYYGGLIGGVLGALLGIRLSGCNFAAMENSLIPLIPLGHAVGRVGCLLAGCCYGMEYEGILAIYYPNSVSAVSAEQGYFPIQPLEAAVNIAIFGSLLFLEKKTHRPFDLLFAYFGLYALSRIGLELFRGDDARGVWLGVSVSQWIGLVMLAACVIFLVCRSYNKRIIAET